MVGSKKGTRSQGVNCWWNGWMLLYLRAVFVGDTQDILNRQRSFHSLQTGTRVCTTVVCWDRTIETVWDGVQHERKLGKPRACRLLIWYEWMVVGFMNNIGDQFPRVFCVKFQPWSSSWLTWWFHREWLGWILWCVWFESRWIVDKVRFVFEKKKIQNWL